MWLNELIQYGFVIFSELWRFLNVRYVFQQWSSAVQMVNRTNHGCWLGQSAGFYPITFYDLSGGRMAPPKIPFTHPTNPLVMQSSERPRKLFGEPPSNSELPSLTQYVHVSAPISESDILVPKLLFSLSLFAVAFPRPNPRAQNREERDSDQKGLSADGELARSHMWDENSSGLFLSCDRREREIMKEREALRSRIPLWLQS